MTDPLCLWPWWLSRCCNLDSRQASVYAVSRPAWVCDLTFLKIGAPFFVACNHSFLQQPPMAGKSSRSICLPLCCIWNPSWHNVYWAHLCWSFSAAKVDRLPYLIGGKAVRLIYLAGGYKIWKGSGNKAIYQVRGVWLEYSHVVY